MQASRSRHSAEVRAQQRRWAAECGQTLDAAGYCVTHNENLFIPLRGNTLDDFTYGDGGEVGRVGRRGKLQAVHSSSALACNVFDYWRGQDAGPLARALRLGSDIAEIKFEQKFPTGVSPRSPNLDVVLSLADGSLTAVESKFLEPYGASAKRRTIQEKYFNGDAKRWQAAGLVGAQRVAEAVRDGKVSFEYLDAPQLLKHMLGLGKQSKAWQLLYLWFDPKSDTEKEHQTEIARFTELLREDAPRFRSASYSEMFARMQTEIGEGHQEYVSYLKGRYFGE